MTEQDLLCLFMQNKINKDTNAKLTDLFRGSSAVVDHCAVSDMDVTGCGWVVVTGSEVVGGPG